MREFEEVYCCYKCGEKESDIMETQEWLIYQDCGGYGSVFGDGNIWRIQLCQSCLKETLGKYVRIKD